MTRAYFQTAASHDLADHLITFLDNLDREEVIERLWAKDHTLWKPEPTEISNRLGWLDLVRQPPERNVELLDFVAQTRADGLRDVVLLGMGGSSLGAEALRSSFGSREEGLRLHVLDSTHPLWVQRVRQSVDPAHSLFLVASKSGTTAEVMAFFKYFWGECEATLGDATGRHFAAITDPGTPLLELATARGFRKVFINPPDIGGRFSVLSRFGMVPAALAGIDPHRLLSNGHRMADACGPGSHAKDNPGAWLGALLGAAVAVGRSHLTLITSRRIADFGLWAEQLIAESTGKEGTGILPITAEPLIDAEAYDDRRLFVGMRLLSDTDDAFEQRIAALAEAGQPLVVYDLEDAYDLGAEFFRWQMATAVAGHLMKIQPFDQPDVQSTKTQTRRLLDLYDATGELPVVEVSDDLQEALHQAPRPTYVALMVYADRDEALEEQIDALRRHLLTAYGVATTFGYGPRFLHSTGQLHKGGPAGGLFVQLIAQSDAELEIQGETYGLGLLLRAQAAGDLAALLDSERRCVRIDLGDHPVASLQELLENGL